MPIDYTEASYNVLTPGGRNIIALILFAIYFIHSILRPKKPLR